MAYAPPRKRRSSPGAIADRRSRRRALELLADCGYEGCTEAVILANGIDVDTMVQIMVKGLATATPQRTRAGREVLEVAHAADHGGGAEGAFDGELSAMTFYWQRWRFPYEQSSPWSQDIEQRRRWYKACEQVGIEQVRAQVRAAVDRGAGSPAAIAVGTEQNITLGFCQEWLAWHDRRKAKREDARHWRQLFWPLIVAVLLAAIGWLVMSQTK